MIRTPHTTTQLGSRDFCITRVGFGAWATDGSGWSFGWGPDDDSNSIAAIRDALDLGVDWIDTAAAPIPGNSKEAGAERCDLSFDDRLYVFTKCGLILDEGYRTAEPRHSRWPFSMRQECEASLRRLGVERIDLYQLHWPDETHSGVEESLSATTQTCGGACGAHRTGVIWYSARHADILAETFSRAPATASAVAVAWTLESRGVAGAIVGASSADQIESWIDAATLVLSRANLGEIATAVGRTGTGHRPQLPSALAT
jgi:aryl-alcohol dehydrogenase-like predicted oxidoreductase